MRGITLLGLLAYLMLLTTRPAHAYLDPGQGSLVLQAFLGGTAAIGVLGRWLIQWIHDYFHRPRPR